MDEPRLTEKTRKLDHIDLTLDHIQAHVSMAETFRHTHDLGMAAYHLKEAERLNAEISESLLALDEEETADSDQCEKDCPLDVWPGDVLRLDGDLGDVVEGMWAVLEAGMLVRLSRVGQNEDGKLCTTARVVQVTWAEMEQFVPMALNLFDLALPEE